MSVAIPLVSVRLFTLARLQLAERNGGKGTPEMRIPALFIGSLFVPIGLL